jgi:hypothetical protein
MIWYLAKFGTVAVPLPATEEGDPDPSANTTNVTGPIDDADELWDAEGKKYVVHAYNGTGKLCLVGFYEEPDSVPSSWVSKTVAEARTEFASTKGRRATAKEIL